MKPAMSWVAAQKDWRRLWRDPWKLVLWVGVPLLIGGLMTTVMGGSGGVQPTALLYLDDQDDSLLSGALVGAFSNEKMGGLVEVVRLPHADAVQRLNQNEGSAALLIPKGFQEALLDESPVTLELVTNPAQRILPGILEEVLGMLQEGVFYLHRIFGDELKLLRDSVPDADEFTLADPAVALIAIQVNSSLRDLQDFLDPPLLKLEFSGEEAEPATSDVAVPGTDAAAGDNAAGSAAAAEATASGGSTSSSKEFTIPMSFYMFPSILLMALFFVAQGLSEDFWVEHEAGTLRRFLNSPHSLGTFLVGKICTAFGVYLCLGTLLIAIGFSFHSFLSWSVLPMAVLWWAAGGVGVFLMMSLIQMMATSRRGGSLITNLLMFPLLMLGGSFFPFEAMPDWMVAVGRYTPNGWILQELKPILLQKSNPGGLAISFAGLIVASFFLFLILRNRLRRTALGS